jgi:nitroreductase
MDYESLIELLKSRRSVRRFKPDPLPDDFIKKIIDAAKWAPSGFNMQPWEFVVVTEEKTRKQIVNLIGENGAFHYPPMEAKREDWQKEPFKGEPDPEMDWTTAPVYIILFGDTRTQLGLPMPIRFLYQKRQSIFTSSLASAFLYMHLAATTLGLASMWESGVQNPYVHCLLKDLLGVPPEWEPYDMFIVGYPAQQKRKKLLRNTDRMVHYEKCRPENIRTDDEIKDWIKRARFWTSAAIRRGPKK